MHDTPLGRIIAIRSEKDPKVIKEFSKEEREIRNKWLIRRNRELKKNKAVYEEYWKGFQNWAKEIFKENK